MKLGEVVWKATKATRKKVKKTLKKVYSDEMALAFAADMQIEQLEEGKTNKGEDISPGYRSDDYAALQQSRYPNPKRQEGTPLLKNKGDFYDGIFVKATSQGLVFDSTDSKTNDLEFKYDDVFSLNEEKLIKLKNEFGDEFYGELLKNALGYGDL